MSFEAEGNVGAPLLRHERSKADCRLSQAAISEGAARAGVTRRLVRQRFSCRGAGRVCVGRRGGGRDAKGRKRRSYSATAKAFPLLCSPRRSRIPLWFAPPFQLGSHKSPSHRGLARTSPTGIEFLSSHFWRLHFIYKICTLKMVTHLLASSPPGGRLGMLSVANVRITWTKSGAPSSPCFLMISGNQKDFLVSGVDSHKHQIFTSI